MTNIFKILINHAINDDVMMIRIVIRGILLLGILVSMGMLFTSWSYTPTDAILEAENQIQTSLSERESIVPHRDDVTVVTTDPRGGRAGTAAIAAFTADGRTLYYNDTYGNYFNVDPDPPGSYSVLYAAGSRYDPCPPQLERISAQQPTNRCAKVVIERLNLSTDKTKQFHIAVTSGDIWHDVDRMDDDSLVITDMSKD